MINHSFMQQDHAIITDEATRLRQLLLQLPCGIAIMRGPLHIYELANELYFNIVGKTELIGFPGREAIPEIVSQGIWDIIDNVYNTGDPFIALEFPVLLDRDKSGSPVQCYFNLNINPIFNEKNVPDGIVIHAVDISEQVNTRNLVQDSGEQFRLLANNIPQIIWKADPKGTIIFFNQYWYNYSGTTTGRKKNWDWALIVHPQDLKDTLSAWRNSLQTGNPFEVEFRLKKSDGTYRWHQGRASAMRDTTGKIMTWIGANSDIHDQKASEEALENAVEARTRALSEAIKDLSRSNNDLEQFAYVASHDMKEPIRMVSNYAMLLSQKYRNKIDPEADEFIGYITEGAKRMQELIEDLLAYSRIGRTDASESALIDCNKVFEIAKANLHEIIEDSGANLEFQELPTIHGKEPQLVRLFQNILGNSLKFRSPDKTPEIQIKCEKRSEQYLFSIADNGIGISPEYAEKIFVIFQRLHNREKYGGTGIGLAVCKKIVELHGGKIWVESDPGNGATFKFTLNG
jgi:PAS domain S-box-containing protein